MRSLLFLGLFLFFLSESKVEGKHLGCFRNFEHGHNKLSRRLYRSLVGSHHPPVQPKHLSADSCEAYVRSSSDISQRSLSPWRTSTVEMKDMYPSAYEEAECLCDGCIINGSLNRSYNSVPVQRTHLFLKKVPCPSDPKKYALEFKEVQVTVACTCAVPNSN